MKIRHYIAATAGHIDHGKSALVQALTGVDPDRLPEEKRRGITIELGFAKVDLPVAGRDLILQVGIVDVPGHEDFVKNMVAGVGAVDLAILVVAANEGWMPQTEEHLQIVEYLGARARIIALTKSDLLPDLAPRSDEVRRLAAGTGFADCPIVPVSAVRNTGLEELRREMTVQLAPLPPAAAGTPRLAVDRTFTMAGAGTVVTGTLSGGGLERGQEVEVWPSGERARIRALESFNRSADRVGPATRVAVNLSTARSARGGGRSIRRGDVVTNLQAVAAGTRFDARLTRSARTTGGRPSPLLRDGARVRLHHGTANVAATVRLEPACAKVGLAAGAGALARIQLDEQRPLLIGDHLVLRDWSQRYTLAGGVILDPAPRRPLRSAAQLALLNAVAHAPHRIDSVLRARAATHGTVDLNAVGRLLPADDQEVKRAASALAHAAELRLLGNTAADAKWFARQVDAAAKAIATELQRHPERTGVPMTVIRAGLTGSAAEAGVMDAVLAELQRRGYQRAGSAIRPPGHAATLPPGLDRAAAAMRAALAANPLAPPSRGQLTDSREGRSVLEYLISAGEVVALSSDVVLAAAVYRKARATVVAFLRRHRSGTTSALRTAVGTNRRVIVPLLEQLDRAGVTLRVGNERRLAAAPPHD